MPHYKWSSAKRVVSEITIHNNIPCKIGFNPTAVKIFLDNPQPIKNKVTVSPNFDIVTIEVLNFCIKGT